MRGTSDSGDVAERGAGAGGERVKDRNQRLRAEAAARRKAKRQVERATSGPAGLDAAERMYDALTRAVHATSGWLRRHFHLVQWVLVLAVVGGLGWQLYSWRAEKTRAKRSDALASAITKFQGWVEATPSENTQELFGQVRPEFPSDEARLKAASEAYEQAARLAPGSTTAMLARLGLAGVFYQQGNFDKALEAYRDIERSELFREDGDVRGRVLEGIALSLEAKGDRAGALKAFKVLENADLLGFEAAALYHQARLHFSAENEVEAQKALTEAKKRLEKWAGPEQPAVYLQQVIRELDRAMNPDSAGSVSTRLGGRELSDDPAELQRLVQELMKAQPKGKTPDPAEPPPATPAPATSAADSHGTSTPSAPAQP